VLAFATSQIPADKVLLGLAFYGYDWKRWRLDCGRR
jgi:spore germination protein YaaH